jgi:hypothetical protein
MSFLKEKLECRSLISAAIEKVKVIYFEKM